MRRLVIARPYSRVRVLITPSTDLTLQASTNQPSLGQPMHLWILFHPFLVVEPWQTHMYQWVLGYLVAVLPINTFWTHRSS